MIMDPAAVPHVVLTGHNLTLERMVAVARFHAEVSVSDEAV